MKKKIVVSAVNLSSGGTLSILVDFIKTLPNDRLCEYIFLVHDKSILPKAKNTRFVEFPNVKKSWVKRLLFEYVSSYFIARRIKPFFWLSLHDMTPLLPVDIKSGVYCHNPSPFQKLNWNYIFLDYKVFLFSLFYKYLYRININRNRYVFVQQAWLADEFSQFTKSEIIVTKPESETKKSCSEKNLPKREKKFFYPSLGRPFKNFEIILRACEILDSKKISYDLSITIDGSENKYTKNLLIKYGHLQNVNFLGLIKREKVDEIYGKKPVVIFPSKLETWGLPLSEAKSHGLKILAADLPYARETIGSYDQVSFFDPDDNEKLAKLMGDLISNQIIFDGNKPEKTKIQTMKTWSEFHNLIKN